MIMVKRVDVIHKCFNCKRIAGFKIEYNRPITKDVFLCKECFSDLYLSFGKLLVPKGIENINKKIKIKE